jgi:hypothetical protein
MTGCPEQRRSLRLCGRGTIVKRGVWFRHGEGWTIHRPPNRHIGLKLRGGH